MFPELLWVDYMGDRLFLENRRQFCDQGGILRNFWRRRSPPPQGITFCRSGGSSRTLGGHLRCKCVLLLNLDAINLRFGKEPRFLKLGPPFTPQGGLEELRDHEIWISRGRLPRNPSFSGESTSILRPKRNYGGGYCPPL